MINDDPEDCLGGEILVAVATYLRPEMLRDCLNSVLAQKGVEQQITIVVVDNDPGRSASTCVQQFEQSPRPVYYLHQPVPGIASARNMAVDFARELDIHWLVFIDDDEVADPEWLRRLLRGADEFGADLAQGAVLSRLEPGGPKWIVELNLFGRIPEQRGAHLRSAISGNLLLRLAVLDPYDQPFNTDLNLVGGEDTELTARLHKTGTIIVSVPDAVVTEFVPLNRQTVPWLQRRSERSNAGWVGIERNVLQSHLWRTKRILASARFFVIGITQLIVGTLTRTQALSIRGKLALASAKGTAVGLLGGMVQEYTR